MGFRNPDLRTVLEFEPAQQNALLNQQTQQLNQLRANRLAQAPEERNYLLQQRENAATDRQSAIADADYARGRRPTAEMGEEITALRSVMPSMGYQSYLDSLPMLQQRLPSLGGMLPNQQRIETEAAQAGVTPEAYFEQSKQELMGGEDESLTFEEQMRRDALKQRQKLGIAQEFDTSEEDELRLDAAKQRQKLGIAQEFETDEPPSFEQKKKLRSEFIKGSGTFVKVRDAYNRILVSINDPSAAGDVALIFNYMKMLDPGSVVRESEYAVAANAAGVPQRIRALWNRTLDGERLSQATRTDFADTAERLFKQQSGSQKKLISEYGRLAERAGIDAQDVIIDYTTDQGRQVPKTASDYLKKFEQ